MTTIKLNDEIFKELHILKKIRIGHNRERLQNNGNF